MVLFPAPPGADTSREDLDDPRGGRAGRSGIELRCRQCGPVVEKLLFKVSDLEERLTITRMVAAEAEAKAEGERLSADKMREELDQEIAEGRAALVMSQGEQEEALLKHEAEVKLMSEELAAARSTIHELNATVRELRQADTAAQAAHEGEQLAHVQEESEKLRIELDKLHSELKLRPMPEECDRLRAELQTVRAELRARPPPEECDQLRSELHNLRAELNLRPTSNDAAKMQAKLKEQSALIKHYRDIESHLDQLAAELKASQAREQEAQATLAKMTENLASTRSDAMVEGSKWFDELIAADRKAAIAVREEANKWVRELASSQKRELRLKNEMRGLREELRLLANVTGGGLAGKEVFPTAFSSPCSSPPWNTRGFSPTASPPWHTRGISPTTWTASPPTSAAETPVAICTEQHQVLSPSRSPSPVALAAWSPARAQSAARSERARLTSRSPDRALSAQVSGTRTSVGAPKPPPVIIATMPGDEPLPAPAPAPSPSARSTIRSVGTTAMPSPAASPPVPASAPATRPAEVVRLGSAHNMHRMVPPAAQAPRADAPRRFTGPALGIMPTSAPSRPSSAVAPAMRHATPQMRPAVNAFPGVYSASRGSGPPRTRVNNTAPNLHAVPGKAVLWV
mmetsp:Transcript_99313/g.286585  ORF Transcript_99313/g.286585 Transcript_99313/m.286585 type:complete len:632 (-) Transcript_99313:264-2159(-)